MSFEDKFEYLRNDDELYQKIRGSTGEDGVLPADIKTVTEFTKLYGGNSTNLLKTLTDHLGLPNFDGGIEEIAKILNAGGTDVVEDIRKATNDAQNQEKIRLLIESQRIVLDALKREKPTDNSLKTRNSHINSMELRLKEATKLSSASSEVAADSAKQLREKLFEVDPQERYLETGVIDLTD